MAQTDFANFLAANTATANAAETVVATSRPVSSPAVGSQFFIQFGGIFTAGAGTTAVTFQIRRVGLTGTSVYSSGAMTIAATNIVAVTFATIDALANDVASVLWVLTALQTGGTGAGGLTNSWSAVTVPV